MLVETLRHAMLSAPEVPEKSDEGFVRYNRIARFLMDVSCCAGSESLHDSIADIAEALSLSAETVGTMYEPRTAVSPDMSVRIPGFIADLNRPGGADRVLVQAFSRGRPAYFTSQAMARDFASAAECEAAFVKQSCDPNAAMRRLVGGRYRSSLLKTMGELLLGAPCKDGTTEGATESQASLVASVKRRDGAGEALCLLDLRAYVSEDLVVIGVRLTPDPEEEFPDATSSDPMFYNLGKALKLDLESPKSLRCSPSPPKPTARKTAKALSGLDSASMEALAEIGSASTSSFDNQRVYLEKRRAEKQQASPKNPLNRKGLDQINLC